MRNKKAIEMSFNTIFAIIAGAFILFLAIMAGARIMKIGSANQNTQTASALVGYLSPFETGLASGKSAQLNFVKDTRFRTNCYTTRARPFGLDTIAFSEKTFGDEFSEYSKEIDLKTKFLFVENVVQGKNYFLFSQPLKLPYKIGDVTVMASGKYCFVSPPNSIENKLKEFGIKNIIITDNIKNCTDSKTVCFNTGDCDIRIQDLCSNNCENLYDIGRVFKNGKELYYVDNLLYGAIFSSPDIYDCNVERLSNKLNELSKVYLEKIDLIERKGCSSRAKNQIQMLGISAANLNKSADLLELYNLAKQIDAINEAAGGCELY